MPVIAKISRVLMVLCGLVALFWFILPFWQIAAGMADGILPFIVCWMAAGFFFVLGVCLYFCYRLTRSREIGSVAHIALWGFVALSGALITGMALRILYLSLPH
jgi:hypothetical protein